MISYPCLLHVLVQRSSEDEQKIMQKSGLLEALPIQTTIVWYFSQWLFNGSLPESLYNNHKVSNLILGYPL